MCFLGGNTVFLPVSSNVNLILSDPMNILAVIILQHLQQCLSLHSIHLTVHDLVVNLKK